MVQMNFRFVEEVDIGGTTDAYAGLNWSYSRREALEHCTRKYFFQYYFSAITEAELKRKISFLRGVKNRHLRTGEIAHLVIATYFKKLRVGKSLSEGWLTKWAKELFQKDRRYSLHIRNGGAVSTEVFPPTILDEVIGNSEDSEKVLAFSEEQMIQAVQTFFRAPSFAELRALGSSPDALIECKVSLAGFPVPVTGKIDLAGNRSSDVTLVDWKIGGATDGGTESLQLAIYGRWAANEFRTTEENIRVVKAHLASGELVEFNANQNAFANARVRILQDLERLVILHGYGKRGVMDAFTPNPREGICRLCPFREVCPEGKAVSNA